MKNVLFMVDYYLPNASANGICVRNVVKEFLDNNVKVSIICFRDKNQTSLFYGKEMLRGEKIYNIPVHIPSKSRSTKALYYLKWIFCKKRLPYENKSVVRKMLDLAEKVVVDDEIDTVVCTHLPIETLVVGKKLKERNPSLKMISYMLDSLSGGFVPRFLPDSFCRKKKIMWENRVLKAFDKIILMESSREHHEKNSKDESWYRSSEFLDVPALCPVDSVKSDSSKQGSEIIFGFVGSLCDGVRTPYALLETLSNISDVKIKFIIAGKNNCGDLNRYVKNSECVTLDVKGLVSYDEAKQILADSDFLVNFGNSNSNLVPSKIFEYMSYGKPIISTYVCSDDSSIPYLNEYPAVHMIDEREKNISISAERLKKFVLENRNVRVSRDRLVDKMYNNTPMAVYSFISSIG